MVKAAEASTLSFEDARETIARRIPGGEGMATEAAGEQDEDGARARPVTIEDVVEALSAQCDGAKSRDGRGFSRADANEGGRLSALKKRGMAWSADDARKALEIVSKYPVQASALLGAGHEGRVKGIASAIRGSRIGLRDPVTERQEPYNYCALSPGGKQVSFWRLVRVDDLGALNGLLRQGARVDHGVRRNFVDANARADITLNGQRRRAGRTVVDYNGTTRPYVLEAARRHGFLLDPAVEASLDEEVDALRRHERAAWLYRGVREGRKGVWVVFDLARKHPPFSAEVKERLKGRFACLEHDDWNWYVEFDRDTLPGVGRLIQNHGFAISGELRRILVNAVRAHRERAGRP